MTHPYDPCEEFSEYLDVPDDPADDSRIRAMARFRKLMDVQSSIGPSGTPAQKFDQAASDRLRRDVEGERKAGNDPLEALKCADPHGLIPAENKRKMLESRGFDPDEYL